MKRLSSAQFRRSYAHESDPVEVTSFDRLLGTWIPAGVALPDMATEPLTPEREEWQGRFSIRPQKRPRPVLTAQTVTVRDPLDVRKHEQETQVEIQPRIYQTRRA